jgi:hypothetical protein
MPRIKYNAEEIGRRYITGTESIRSIASDIGVSFSSLAQKARNEDWAAKRAAYQQTSGQLVAERVADRWAAQKAEVIDEMLIVLRKTIRKFNDRLNDTENPPVITTKDVTLAMQQLLLLLGEPTQRTEERHLGFNFTAEVDPELLRRIEELTRGAPDSSDDRIARSYLEGAGPH